MDKYMVTMKVGVMAMALAILSISWHQSHHYLLEACAP